MNVHTQRIAAFSILSTLLVPAAAPAAPSTPEGVWRTFDDKTKRPASLVKIWQHEGRLFGKILELFDLPDPNPVCTACTGERKNKPIVGMTIMWNLTRDDDEWEDGEILDPANGETYRCKVWLDGEDLKVRGYAGLFYRTQTWKRSPGPSR